MKRNAGMKEGSVYELDGRVPLKKAFTWINMITLL